MSSTRRISCEERPEHEARGRNGSRHLPDVSRGVRHRARRIVSAQGSEPRHAVGRARSPGHVEQRGRAERALRAAARVRRSASSSPTPSSRSGRRKPSEQLQSDNSDFDVETADRSNAGAVGSATSPPPHWLERGKISRRTSLVIDPPDGRVPALTQRGRRPSARRHVRAGRLAARRLRTAPGPEPLGALHQPRHARRDLPDGLQRQPAHRAGAGRRRHHLRDDSRHARHSN